MIKDARYLATLDDMNRELLAIISEHNTRASGKEGVELITICCQRSQALVEACRKHQRTLEYLLGKPIEPEVHLGEAVLLPVLGGGV